MSFVRKTSIALDIGTKWYYIIPKETTAMIQTTTSRAFKMKLLQGNFICILFYGIGYVYW